MSGKFKIGDLVRIKSNTDDEKIPESRCGLIVAPARTMRSPVHFTEMWRVMMTNGNILQFHEMFLEPMEAEKHD